MTRRKIGHPLAAAILFLFGTLPAAAQSGYYEMREWAGPSNGVMNISSFVFRDLNANGIYDLGDRPFVNIAVELLPPSGVTTMQRTNVDGYANFIASLAQEGHEIPDAGTYTFRVVPPPGWIVSTDNGEQAITMSRLEGAPGDLVAAATPKPVGLVREASETNAPVQTALPPDLSAPDAVRGETITIGFDDLLAGTGLLKIPNGYHGLHWSDWVAIHSHFYGGEGYINTAMSGEHVAYTSSGHPATIAGDRPFDFLGGYFGTGWGDAEGETLRIRAWRGEILVHDDTLTLSAYGPAHFAANYRGITRIEFATTHYWQAVADDLQFVIPDPEP